MMKLASWYFLLLIPLILYGMYGLGKKQALDYSSVKVLQVMGMKRTYKQHIGKGLIAFSLCIMVVALSRPQISEGLLPKKGEGIDIVMVLDVSGSMESVDMEPSRLEVARQTISEFIDSRVEDRLGLVLFSGSAYTRVPLTLDHQVLQQSLELVTTDSVSEEGTAIGMAMSVGINRLKKSDAASKVMILVTDGDNNAGAIDPEMATELANEMGIKVYTIGVGTDQTIIPEYYFGQVSYRTVEGGLNEPLLQSVADGTGGAYYRARDEQSFENVFSEINALEKTEFERDAYEQYRELAFPLMKAALLLMALGLFLKRYRYIEVP